MNNREWNPEKMREVFANEARKAKELQKREQSAETFPLNGP